ncbi:ABC transporter ATP-binding protein [Granulosicoccus sp. 3-233]|uniref:ABC transporter ATP-binding protein n=1 Tax=Granulosicoccus sp. 3-233 TaxID=3417969 RepID=UPI003D332CBF
MADSVDQTGDDALIEVRHLYKRFGAVNACEDVSLDLRRGEIHALIGPNGAGKSTLIRQISGQLRHDSGQILLAGKDIGDLSMTERARAGLAQSFQVSMVIPEFCVQQNVMLAVQGKSGSTFRFFGRVDRQTVLIDKARDFLAQVDLLDRASIIAAELSHGERRKLELCMALAMEPRAFILDEPMAGVGAAGSRAMTRLLASLKLKAPVLLVEHDMDAVFALADRLSVLVYGRIIATGTVAEIRRNPEVREAYMGNVDEPENESLE